MKIFRNGRNQAVRIPREFALPDDDAIMRNEDDRLIIGAIPPKPLLAILAGLAPIADDFAPFEDAPPEPFTL